MPDATVSINSQRLGSLARQAGSIASIVVGQMATWGAIGAGTTPQEIGGSILTAIGGLVLAIEHYVSDPSTGSTATGSTKSNA